MENWGYEDRTLKQSREPEVELWEWLWRLWSYSYFARHLTPWWLCGKLRKFHFYYWLDKCNSVRDFTKVQIMYSIERFQLCVRFYKVFLCRYMFDRSTAERILPPFIQDVCFMMVVSNSCMNPIIYGSFVMDFKKCSCQCTDCGEKTSTDSLIPSKFNIWKKEKVFFPLLTW